MSIESPPAPFAMKLRQASQVKRSWEDDKMETVEALLSLSDSSRSPGGSPEKPLITILPAHSLKGELSRI